MLFLSAFGIFLFFFGIGACLGLIYATWKSRFIIAEIFRDIGRIIIGTASIFKEGYYELKAGIKQGWEEAKAEHEVWLEKKGWK